MRFSRVFAAGFVGALLVLSAPAPASACSCIQATPAQQAARADVVFVGRLASIEGPPPAPVRSSMDLVTYRFDVERVLKGAAPSNASVRSVFGGASCGLEGMREDEHYTVFARLDGTTLTSSLCDGTYAGDPDASLAALTGTLLPPEPVGPPFWVGIAALAVAALAFWRSRVWRRFAH